MAPISYSVYAMQHILISLNFLGISAWLYDDILDTILITDTKLLDLKNQVKFYV